MLCCVKAAVVAPAPRRVAPWEPDELRRTTLIAIAIALGFELLAVLTDFAINLVTPSHLPGPLANYGWVAVPVLAATLAIGVVVAVRERLKNPPLAAPGPRAANPPRPANPPSITHNPSSQLPPDFVEFTGRESDLETLRGLVNRAAVTRPAPTVITIYGQPGVGKSTLAIHFVHEVRAQYPDAQLYIDLKGASPQPHEAAEALSRLVHAMGVGGPDLPSDLDGLGSAYRDRLQGKRAIVLLDNARSAAQVRPLLPGLATCLVLITSRPPLHELVGSHTHRLTVMGDADSIALLVQIAGDHVLTGEGEVAAAEVAELCGHLPLALSIAGVRLRSQPIGELVARLRDRRSRLGEFRAGERDVRASFEVSYEHLTSRERMLFCRLRLLPEASFAPEMAAALLDCPLREASDTLERLVEQQVLERAGAGRFAFNDLIGLYADEKLEKDPGADRRAAHERALRLYLTESLRRAALLDASILELSGGQGAPLAGRLDEQLETLDWFERERPRLVTLCRQASEIEAHEVTWKLGASLVPFFELRGHRADWVEVQEMALRAARACDEYAVAWTKVGAGHLRWLDRKPTEAGFHLGDAYETAEAGEWPRIRARALYLRGRVEHQTGRLDAALERYQQAAQIFQSHGMVQELASTIFRVAALMHQQGEIGTGEIVHLAELVLAALTGLPEELWTVRTIGRIKEYLGRTMAELGERESASVNYIASSIAFRRIGFRHGRARVLRDLGQMRIERSNWTQACNVLEDSTALFGTIGDRYDEGLTLILYGNALNGRGEQAQALACWRDAQAALAEVGAPEEALARERIQLATQ